MKRYFFLILFCISVLFAEGQKGVVRFEQIVDNTVELGSDIQTLVLMSRAANGEYQNYDTDTLTKSLVNHEYAMASVLLIDSSSIDTLIMSMASTLYNSGRYQVVVPTDINIHRDEDYDVVPPPLTKEEVRKYCADYDADALVVLERYFNGFDCLTSSDYYEGIVYGYFLEAVGFYGYVRVYDAKNANIVSNYAASDTLVWQGTIRDNFVQVPDMKEAIISTAFVAGEDCARLISPIWQEQIRKYYHIVRGAQSKEDTLFQPENFEDAEAYWMSLLTGETSDKKKSRAAYNLAVLYEMNGHTTKALSWVEKAITLKYDIIYERYINLLKKRIALEKQLGLLQD
ncbi:MAG: DUF6340 family protein [Bacteroidales bacterium]